VSTSSHTRVNVNPANNCLFPPGSKRGRYGLARNDAWSSDRSAKILDWIGLMLRDVKTNVQDEAEGGTKHHWRACKCNLCYEKHCSSSRTGSNLCHFNEGRFHEAGRGELLTEILWESKSQTMEGRVAESEVFGWSRIRNTGSRSRIFCPTPDAKLDHFL